MDFGSWAQACKQFAEDDISFKETAGRHIKSKIW